MNDMETAELMAKELATTTLGTRIELFDGDSSVGDLVAFWKWGKVTFGREAERDGQSSREVMLEGKLKLSADRVDDHLRRFSSTELRVCFSFQPGFAGGEKILTIIPGSAPEWVVNTLGCRTIVVNPAKFPAIVGSDDDWND